MGVCGRVKLIQRQADPDNCVKTFEEYEDYLPPKGHRAGHIFDKQRAALEIREQLDTVKGHL